MESIEPPEPRAQQLLRILVEEIKSGRIQAAEPGSFPSYSRLIERLGRPSPGYLPGMRLAKLGLKTLNEWTMRHPELPKVTALIVNKGTHLPGKGFAESHGHQDDPDWKAWWLKEAERAIHHDWAPFLVSTTVYELEPAPQGEVAVREGEDETSYEDVIVKHPPPARIRQSGITVAEVLRWLAAGESEKEIIRLHPGLKGSDIRATLAFAADREESTAQAAAGTFTSRWAGKFALPASDPDDARLSYLLGRYERSAQ